MIVVMLTTTLLSEYILVRANDIYVCTMNDTTSCIVILCDIHTNFISVYCISLVTTINYKGNN